MQKLPAAKAKARAWIYWTGFGLSVQANDFPDRLSGGQAQRTAMTRALAYQARLLLLDEITNALDLELVDMLSLVREVKEQRPVLPGRLGNSW